jgi:hypothetical protein
MDSCDPAAMAQAKKRDAVAIARMEIPFFMASLQK